MKKNEQVELVRRLGIRPSRKLGQNFLIDGNIRDRIADHIRGYDTNVIVEIGPGTGTLTERLVSFADELIAVEYDNRLADYLSEEYTAANNFRLVHADACRVAYDDLTSGREFICVGNLPYAISTKLLSSLLALENRPTAICFLVQREMADRVTASHGCKTYGSISVLAQSLYLPRIERTISAKVFWPEPRVESALLTLSPRSGADLEVDFRSLESFVRAAFSHRRKRLINVLSGVYDPERLRTAFQELGIDPDSRAENVTVEQYCELTRMVKIAGP